MTFSGAGKLGKGSAPDRQEEETAAVNHTVRRSVRKFLKTMGETDPDDLYRIVLDEVEKPLLEEVLRWTSGNQCRAAAVLGISRGTLRKKIQTYKIL